MDFYGAILDLEPLERELWGGEHAVYLARMRDAQVWLRPRPRIARPLIAGRPQKCRGLRPAANGRAAPRIDRVPVDRILRYRPRYLAPQIFG